MSWSIIRVFFRETYDELFRLVVANLCWLGLSLPIVTLPAATLALYEFAHGVLCHQDPEYSVLWRGVRKWFWRSFVVLALLGLSLLLPAVGVVFYLRWAQSGALVAYALFALNFWVLVFVLLCQVYFIPLLVHQGISIGKALKRSALMVLYRPTASLVVFALSAFLWVLGFVAPPYLVFLFASTVAMLKTTALLVGLEEYED